MGKHRSHDFLFLLLSSCPCDCWPLSAAWADPTRRHHFFSLLLSIEKSEKFPARAVFSAPNQSPSFVVGFFFLSPVPICSFSSSSSPCTCKETCFLLLSSALRHFSLSFPPGLLTQGERDEGVRQNLFRFFALSSTFFFLLLLSPLGAAREA